MIDTSLAHPAHTVPESEATGDLEHVETIVPRALKLSPRLQRGITLAQEHFEEIHRIVPWIWSVPSCSGSEAGVYVVNLKTSECSCPDRPPEGERCKHISAASYVKAKTAICHGCGFRKRHRDLYEVHEDHESLSRFPGDLLCEGCALDSGIL